MKSNRATIAAIAAHAGVSQSTVDRVLNSRARVRGETADLVLEAARAMNYHGLNLLTQRVDEVRKAVNIGLLLQNRSNPFFQDLCDQIRRYVNQRRPECRKILIEEFEEPTPQSMSARIAAFSDKVDILGVMAFDHPLVNDAIAGLQARGRKVVAILSDLSGPAVAGYVGIDHQKAGRTAGWALARLTGGSGKIGLLIESYQYRAFQDREIGLRNYILEHEPGIQLCEGVYGIASTSVVERLFEELLTRHPDLKGLYFVGAGVSAVLKHLDTMPEARRPVIVCHELTPVVRDALATGAVGLVLDSPREELAREIVDRLIVRATDPMADRVSSIIDFRIYCPANL